MTDPTAPVEQSTDLADRIRAALKDTTPGPWEFDIDGILLAGEKTVSMGDYGSGIDVRNLKDEELIAAAPTLLAEALARIEELETEVEIWRP